MSDAQSPQAWADAAERCLRAAAPERLERAAVRYALAQLRDPFDAPGWMYECLRLLGAQCPDGALDPVVRAAAGGCLVETSEHEPGWFLAFDDVLRCEPEGALWCFDTLLRMDDYDPQVLAHLADRIAARAPGAPASSAEAREAREAVLARCAEERGCARGSRVDAVVRGYALRRALHALGEASGPPPARPPLRVAGLVGSDAAYVAFFDPAAFVPSPARFYRGSKSPEAELDLLTVIREQRGLGFGTGGDGGYAVRITDGPLEPAEREAVDGRGAFALAAPSGVFVLEGDERSVVVAVSPGRYRVEVCSLDSDRRAELVLRDTGAPPEHDVDYVIQLAPLDTNGVPDAPDEVPVFW